MFQRWLDAREANAVRSAWRALSPRRHELAHPHRKTTKHGAALLAGAMLGERADWLVALDDSSAKPDKEHGTDTDDGYALDDALDSSARYRQWWRIFERHDGTRGVQYIVLEISTLDPPWEGGGFRVVRIFDRDRAVSVVLDSNQASTIGDVDLAPLDLYDSSRSFALNVPLDDVSTVERLVATTRGAAARLAGLDVQGAAIDVVVEQGPASKKVTATVNGLPWGHHMQIYVETWGTSISGYLHVRLPNAEIDRVLAELATIATLR